MGKNELDTLKQRLPGLPKEMRAELSRQIQEMEYRTEVAKNASSTQSNLMRHANAEVTQMLDQVGKTLDDYQSLPPNQQRELVSQVDRVLENNRSLLDATYQESLRQIQSAPSTKQKNGGFLDEFADEVMSMFKGDK